MKLTGPHKAPGILIITGVAAASLALTSCAGSVGTAEGEGAGDGFEYGTPQDEVHALIDELEPVTVTFQTNAASENSVLAKHNLAFADLVEERSNGQISVDIVWGQAIAGFDEVDDALADGRLDIAITAPTYAPEEYPVFNDLLTVSAGMSSSPYRGMLLTNRVVQDVVWQSDALLDSYEEEGLVPLAPLLATSEYYAICNTPVVTSDDWEGALVRAASTEHAGLIQDLGGSPVSLAYSELFEALQRGTVDCSLGPLAGAVEGGSLEIAPHLSYMPETGISRGASAVLAGPSFNELPLAYQQIIFDSIQLADAGFVEGLIGGNAQGMKLAKEHGGKIQPFDEEVLETIDEHSQEVRTQTINNGNVAGDIQERIEEATKKWNDELDTLGYADEGDPADFDQWYDEDTDFTDYAVNGYENGAAMSHRPE